MEQPKEDSTQIEENDIDKKEQKDEIKEKRLEQLKKLKEKMAKANKFNSKAVELEAKRKNSDSYLKHEERKEWAELKEKEKKDYKLRGINDSNYHLITTAETAQKKTEQKKQKEKNRINNYGWNIFSDEARYRGYEKRLKNLPTNADSAKESEELYSDMLDFGMKSRLTEEQINRVVEDQKKQDESNANFSKRRKFYNQEEVDYINERNRAFNRKLGRYYDRFTSDIRANLERGSAV